jgi:hypothetical protein
MLNQLARSGPGAQVGRTSSGLRQQRAARIARGRIYRAAPVVDSLATSNGSSPSSSNGKHASTCPTPAETARTIVDIVNEGSLCSLSADGSPLGAPVAYQLDKDGQPIIQVVLGSPEAANIQRDARVSLLVQPTAFPARGVASVALQGSVVPHEVEEEAGSSSRAAAFKLEVNQAVYYGGLDNVRMQHRRLRALASSSTLVCCEIIPLCVRLRS